MISELAQLIMAVATLLGVAGQIYMSMRNGTKIDAVHQATNGMKDELVSEVRTASLAKGLQQGRDEADENQARGELMPLRNAVPYRHSPTGVCDSLDGTQTFPGAMAALQNLVPDPTTRNLWVPRPAAIELTTFAGFTSPTTISCYYIAGTFVFGMIASSLHPGKDQPFCYNIATNAFVAISGITATNLPSTLATSGPWVPPHMDLIGTKITLAHAGFDGITHFVGWIDISNTAAPVWSSGNTSGSALPSVPIWVVQFTQRAYYFVNPVGAQPAIIATDVLDPTTRSNVAYILTFGDNIPLTCGIGLPLNNVLGGIIASLIVFKGDVNMFQVTGDFASTSSPIASNSLNIATGTLAPNSLCTTPLGVAFISPEGLRLIDFTARVTDPIGEPSEKSAGVVIPFTNAVVPSRVVAACNAKVIRITTENGAAFGSPEQEYWYDLVRKIWTGPHTFPASFILAYGDTFIMAPIGIPASLWQSDASPNLTSTYTEDGTQMMWSYQTTLLPARKDMNQCVMNDTTLYLGFAPDGGTITVAVNDENDTPLGALSIFSPATATIWGDFIWGEALWGGAAGAMAARLLNWTAPIEFDRMSLTVQGLSGAGVRLGDCYFRYQPLAYLAGSYAGAGS